MPRTLCVLPAVRRWLHKLRNLFPGSRPYVRPSPRIAMRTGSLDFFMPGFPGPVGWRLEGCGSRLRAGLPARCDDALPPAEDESAAAAFYGLAVDFRPERGEVIHG